MRTTEQLLKSLINTDVNVRRQAALSLGTVADEPVVPALMAQLRVEYDPAVLEDLTWALVQQADAAREELIGMLTEPDAARRKTAAHVLSKVADPADFEAVAPLVADGVADVAIKAYRAAVNTGGVRALGVLLTRLGDGELLQRDALTNALTVIGEPAVPALVAALGDDRAQVREHAAETLGHMGTPAADPAVLALEELAGDRLAAVRLAAVSALGQLAHAEASLARVADGDDPVTAQVAARLLADALAAQG